MYNLVFALIYHLNARGKGDNPRVAACMVLSLFQGLHFLSISIIILYFGGITRSSFSQISGVSPLIYGFVLLFPFYLLNLYYYKGKRLEEVLHRYSPQRTFRPINILLVILFYVSPIILLGTTAEMRN